MNVKFYREKKPRHFFYTIEYPYPPTNSVTSSALVTYVDATATILLASGDVTGGDDVHVWQRCKLRW